jgi:hypothetical protein
MNAEDLGVGNIITTPQERDAIHVAVAPVIAGELLAPGTHVYVEEGIARRWDGHGQVGIVDPFLRRAVHIHQRFWVFLYPGSITSLRHDWTHPSFEPSYSQQRLADFATSIGKTYIELLDATKDYLDNDAYWHGGSEFEGLTLPNTFWDDYERVTGILVKDEKRESGFFSCSC